MTRIASSAQAGYVLVRIKSVHTPKPPLIKSRDLRGSAITAPSFHMGFSLGWGPWVYQTKRRFDRPPSRYFSAVTFRYKPVKSGILGHFRVGALRAVHITYRCG